MAAEWIVLLEAAREPSSREVDGDTLALLLDAVVHAQPVALHSPDRYAVQLRMAAEHPTEALAWALAAWSEALSTAGIPPWELVRAEVMTRKELETELGLAAAADALRGGDELLDAAFADVVTGLEAERGALAGSSFDCDARWRLLLRGSNETLTLLSEDGSVLSTFAPRAATPIVAGNPTATSFLDNVHPDDADTVHNALAAVVALPGEPVSFVARFGRRDDWSWFESVATNLLDEPLVGAIAVNSHDTTENKRLEERLAEMAERDELTGLVNRTVFLDKLEFALARLTATSHVGVFFVDIVDFRRFVALHGPAVGNQLLASVAERLSTDVFDGATAARLGGDEFALLCEGVDNSTQAAETAKRIARAASTPICVGDDELEASVTIGVALGTPGMLQPATLLRHAEVAMYRARRSQVHYDIYKKRRQPRSSSEAPPSA